MQKTLLAKASQGFCYLLYFVGSLRILFVIGWYLHALAHA